MAPKKEPALVFIKPRPGIILAGIPAAGASVNAGLAKEWIRTGLAVRATPKRTEG